MTDVLTPEVLLTGLTIGESPRWVHDRLWLSDWGTGEIVAVTPDARREVMVRVPTTVPFCFDQLPDGRLLVVSGPEALVLRREPDGALVTHADLREFGSAFNEIVVDAEGGAYVNGFGDDFGSGCVVRVEPDGTARQVADEIAFGNGMALTPDGRTLIVAESFGRRLTEFAVAAAAHLSDRRVWADLGEGAPDGICLDAEGAVWYADVPNRRCVRVRRGGEVLATVPVDRGCFACMLGGPDGRTLYVVAAPWLGFENMFDGPPEGQVLTVRAPAPHAGRP